jgi:protein-tyrosine phosphatase
MIDIHSHILWGVDDGAETIEQSLAMLDVAARSGTTDIVATPHASSEYAFRPDLIADRIEQLRTAAPTSLRIHTGCDFHLSFDNLEELWENPGRYTINGGRYLLVEFSNLSIPPSMSSIFQRLIERGIVPIITHPERNPLLRKDEPRLREWLRQGCLIQVTAQSLLGGFRKPAQDSAWSLVRSEMAQFIASDAHDAVHRPPTLDLAFDAVFRRCNLDLARSLFTENPRAVLEGEPVAYSGVGVGFPPRKWYQAWRFKEPF